MQRLKNGQQGLQDENSLRRISIVAIAELLEASKKKRDGANDLYVSVLN
jgi:hypothetical protein